MKKVLALVVAAAMGLSSAAFAAETATTPAPTATTTKAAPAKTTHHKKQHKAAPAQKAQAAKKHHKNTKAVLNRMSRAIGHMEAVRTMIEDGRDCSEVLIQIAAVRSAINNIGKIILEDHINHCVVDAVETGDTQVLKDLEEAINKFIK